VVVLDEPISLGTYGETSGFDYISDQYRGATPARRQRSVADKFG
jgi:hypothetical protein